MNKEKYIEMKPKNKDKKAPMDLRPVRISADLHEVIKAEYEKTHRDFWAIASDAMRLGLQKMGLIPEEQPTA